MRKRASWLFISWLHIATASIDAGAVVRLNQANETAISSLENDAAQAKIDRRQVAGQLSNAPTYTSYLTTVETVIAPVQTITAFYGGSGEAASIRPTTSTAATVMTPTGTCSVPPTVTAPCAISSEGECVKKYYNALQNCYKDGNFSTLKNVSRYVIECQNELGDKGSYDSFKECSQTVLETVLNRTGAIRPRSILQDGTLLMMGDSPGQRLNRFNRHGMGMMDESGPPHL